MRYTCSLAWIVLHVVCRSYIDIKASGTCYLSLNDYSSYMSVRCPMRLAVEVPGRVEFACLIQRNSTQLQLPLPSITPTPKHSINVVAAIVDITSYCSHSLTKTYQRERSHKASSDIHSPSPATSQPNTDQVKVYKSICPREPQCRWLLTPSR